MKVCYFMKLQTGIMFKGSKTFLCFESEVALLLNTHAHFKTSSINPQRSVRKQVSLKFLDSPKERMCLFF